MRRGREDGAPGGTRTPDLRVRSPALYPTELQAHSNSHVASNQTESYHVGRHAWSLFIVEDGFEPSWLRCAKLALYGREYVVAVQPRERGLVMYTLRQADEVRKMSAIDEFDEVSDEVNDAKIAGEEVVVAEEEAPANVVNLMDALRKSLDSVSQSKKKAAKATKVTKLARATTRKRKRA
jgi:non-homologous end joining protein Ku